MKNIRLILCFCMATNVLLAPFPCFFADLYTCMKKNSYRYIFNDAEQQKYSPEQTLDSKSSIIQDSSANTRAPHYSGAPMIGGRALAIHMIFWICMNQGRFKPSK